MIKGENFILRSLTEEDYTRLYEWSKDEEVRYYYYKRNVFIRYNQIKERHETLNLDRNKEFMIEVENGKTIGNCSLNDIDWINSNCELNILIGDKEYWSKGYGRRVIKKLIDFAFNNLNLYCVYLKVYSFNERGIRCYENCGFTKEAILKDRLYRNGQYYDQVVMSIFNSQKLR